MGLLDRFMAGDDEQPQGLLGSVLNNPVQRALLAASAAGLESSGPSLMPVSNNQALGKMIRAGLEGYDGAQTERAKQQELQDMSAYRQMQTDSIRHKLNKDDQLNDFIMQRLQRRQQSTGAVDGGMSGAGSVSPFSVGGMPQGAGSADGSIPSQPGQSGQPGAGFPFSLEDVALLKLRGVDLSDIYKMATDPIKYEGGSMYQNRATGKTSYVPKLPDGMTMGPGGQVSVAPGFIQGNNAIKGGEAYSQEQAKASFDPFYGVDAAGNKMMLGSRAGVMGGYRAGQQGTQPGYLQDGQQGFVTERSPAATAYDTEMAKSYAERYKDMLNAGMKAPGQIAKLQRLGQLLEDHEGGKFSNSALALAQAANSLGIKVDPKLGNKEAAQAMSNELTLAARDPSSGGGMPGSMSNSDRDFLANMAPNLTQSKQGRKLLIDAGIAVERRKQQVQQMASKYQRKYGRVDDGFYTKLQDWAERNPLFGDNQ